MSRVMSECGRGRVVVVEGCERSGVTRGFASLRPGLVARRNGWGGRSARGRRGGFTLIELLVVIGIIALLVGILLPALARVNQQGKKTQTLALMKNFGDAVDAFVLSNNRMPGALSERQLCSDIGNYGELSGTENANLELMGGLKQKGNDNFQIGADDIEVWRDDIGTASYFKPNPKDLRYVNGQGIGAGGGQADVVNNQPEDGVKALPDLVDAYGGPIIFWANSGLKPSPNLPEINGKPGLVMFETQSGDTNRSAPYFYCSFQSYTSSTELMAGKGGGSPVNQQEQSWLAAAAADQEPAQLAQAIVAHPTLDGVERGGYVIMSAGPDLIFLSRDQVKEPQDDEWTDKDLDRFDDHFFYGGS